MLDELNQYSKRVAARLFAAHPEWEGLARVESGDSSENYLVVEIPPPSSDRPHLAIYTHDDEITVGYDRWHAHYDCWADIPEEQGFKDALDCVHDILSEQTAVAVSMKGDEWTGSRTLERGEEPPPPRDGETVYVRSWLGNRDLQTP